MKIKEIESNTQIDFVEGNVIKTTKISAINDEKISHAYLCDETSSIKISFWGEYAGEFKDGDCVRIENAKEYQVRGEKIISVIKSITSVKKIQKKIICKEDITNKSNFQKIISINEKTNPLYVKGRISEKTDVGSVISRRGKQNRAHAKLCDETGIIEITLWDKDATDVNNGDCIKIENGYANLFHNKLNISSGIYGTLRKISEQIDCTEIKTHDEIKLVKIKNLQYIEKHVSVEGKLKVLDIDDKQQKLSGLLCDETATIAITLWRKNTKFKDGDSIRIEDGMVSISGEPMLTEGYFGKVYHIDKNFECVDKQDLEIEGEIEKI